MCRRGLRGATGRGEGTLILAGSQIAPPAGPRAVGRRRQQQGWRSNLAACFHSTPPTPTPTQTSHWGRQITAQPPVSRAGSNLGDVAPWGGGCRSLRGPKVVKHVLQTLNISLPDSNMSSPSDILSLTLLGRWRITYAAVSGAAQAGCTGQRLISRTGKHFAGFSHALPASSSTGVRTNVGVAPCLPHTCLLSDLACSF